MSAVPTDPAATPPTSVRLVNLPNALTVLRLAADPALRDAMGNEGRRRFAHRFRHETMTDQLRALYVRLLGPTAADLPRDETQS